MSVDVLFSIFIRVHWVLVATTEAVASARDLSLWHMDSPSAAWGPQELRHMDLVALDM